VQLVDDYCALLFICIYMMLYLFLVCGVGATPPPTTKPTTDASRNLSHHALLSGVLAFATVFGNIL